MQHFFWYWGEVLKEVIAKYSVQVVIMYIGLAIFAFLLGIFTLAGFWGIFAKTGEKGWKVLIPFYNLYMLVKISEQKGIRFLLLLVPIVNLVFGFITLKRICERFAKPIGFAIGLFLLPPIFSLILGFGTAECLNPKETEEELYWEYDRPNTD